mgnify:CR=1 FL=1
MKLSKNMDFVNDYIGTNYEVYVDKTHEPKYALVDMTNKEIVKWANKIEKFDKVVYEL